MTDLIIDTDVALGVHHKGRPRDIDDGFAIVEALNAPELNLIGVTCVFGNAPHPDVHRVAREIIDLKASDVPVVPGAVEPMASNPESNAAVEFMAQLLREQRATIAAIGPLTNIGLLIRHAPEVLGNIDELVVVAGRSRNRRFYIGDTGPVNDFNFENDPPAMAEILATDIPLTLAGFELTSQVAITEEDLTAIGAREAQAARYFHENSLAWCRYWTDTFSEDEGFHPWDSATIAWLKHPEYFVAETRRARITTLDEQTVLECADEGKAVTYLTGFTDGGAEAFVQDVVTTVY